MTNQSNSTLNVVLVICLVALTLLAPNRAQAGAPSEITDSEVALLPKYCPYTQSFKYGIRAAMQNSPQTENWLQTVGPGFWHLHHYCWALIQIQRSERSTTPRELRKGYRGAALDNLRYVVKNSPPNLVLLPEIFTWIGRMELLLDRPAMAHEAFAKAWETKNDYWPPYFHWAEHLLDKGQRAEATAVARSGLEHAPETKPLIELLKRLGQKPD